MKTLAEYMSLPYPMEIIPDEGGFVATIPDLPGCMSSGATVDEALSGLEEAKELWIEGKLEGNELIPEPTALEDYSGKFVLRVPKSLHRSLEYDARKQGVSLNQFILHVLSERHALLSLQADFESAFDKLSQKLAASTHRQPSWSWDRPGPKTVLQFIVSSPTPEDPCENLQYVHATSLNADMVFHPWDSKLKTPVCDVLTNRRLGSHK